MSLNTTMLTWHKYWGSKQCIKTIWMRHEASSDSRMPNTCIQFRSIEVQLALNWHAGYNLMAAIAGLPYFDSDFYNQKLPFLYLSLLLDLISIHTSDWTLAETRHRRFMICHKLQSFMIRNVEEFPGYWFSRWAETCIQILSLWALWMDICSHNVF